MPGRVSAVTVTWNSAGVVEGLLGSLLAEGDAVSEVIVVDNGSSDGSAGLARRGYPGVKVIENRENRGFAAAANQGIRASAGKYILLVNPDISFGPGFVSALIEALEKDIAAGSAAPKLVRPGGTVLDSAGLIMRKDRKAVDQGRDEPDAGLYDTPCRVFGACGAAALFSRSMLEEVKEGPEYFDESFFSYKEDVDLAWRANLMGWKAVYVPSAVATHDRGWKVSGRRSVPRFIRRHSHKNRYLTILKNDDPVNLLMHLPQFALYELRLFAYSLLFEPFLFLSFWDIIKHLPGVINKRKAIMAARRLTPREIRRMFGGHPCVSRLS